MGSGREVIREIVEKINKRQIYGSFTVEKPIVGPLTQEQEDKANRTTAYYAAEDKREDIDFASKDKSDRKDAGDVPGLCGSCLNLRWIKTKLGARDRYWCNNVTIRSMLPDGLLDTGDEITKCPFYMPRPKVGEMSLRDMFDKAVMIDIKSYEPESEEETVKRGHIYL